MKELRGNLHVHSDRSDGTLPIPEIARVAADCNLDFVGINDHHALCSDNYYCEGVLILMGTEYNSRHSHYLAYDTPASLAEKQVEGARVVAHVQSNQGLGIIAHPFEKGSPAVSQGRHYPWRDWNVVGYDGIELWNQCSQWREAAKSYGRGLGLWLFNRHLPFFQGACPQALSKWDEVCQKRHITGLAGSDLHAPVFRVLGVKLRILDYPMLFSAVNNYVRVEEVTGNAKVDSANLIAALRRGNCWFAFDRLHLAYGFSFSAEAGEKRAGMGDTLTLAGGKACLRVQMPVAGEITLIRNGKLLTQAKGRELVLSVGEAGVYRVEARLQRRGRLLPWLYSNPLYIQKESS